MILHRAVAYQCQSKSTPANEQQGEVAVFFETRVGQPPEPLLTQLLSAAWGCPADDVAAYNLWSEAELLRNSSLHHSAGDARLLENGWHHGPLFCCPLRTLLLVRPLTVLRLHDARVRARPLQAQQQAAAGLGLSGQQRQVRRHTDADTAARAEFEGLASMGRGC